VKKSEKPRFYGQNKLFFENPALQPLGSCPSALGQLPFSPWAVALQPNRNSPWVHMESELGVLGVHGKLVKYVVHSFKRKN
jgi:hypothetical protein